jgi:hypothetical protein
MLVERLEKEMRTMREECDRKVYEVQREARQAEERRRKETEKTVRSRQELDGEGLKTLRNLQKDKEQEDDKTEAQ